MNPLPLSCSERSTQARKLLSSIQKHIGKLIEDKPESFIVNSFDQSSHLQSPNNSFNNPHPSMNIFQLEASIPKSYVTSERVSSRINKIEQFYVQKIKKLEFRITEMEDENQDLKNHILRLQDNILQSKQNTLKIIGQFQTSKNMKIDNLQQLHLSALQSFKVELQSKLASQKLLRMSIQDQLSKMIEQNTYLKSSHRQLSQNYRRILEVDVNKMKSEIDKENMVEIKRQIKNVKDKSLRLRRKSQVINSVIPEVEKQMKAIRKKMRQL